VAAEKCVAVMNYLAHAHLSFMHEEILIGNMISDFVKGKKKFDYPINIQKGIALHRAIDTFTDTHASTKEAKTYFKSAVGAYSGAFVDVMYDHFLAKDTSSWCEVSLDDFTKQVYDSLEANYHLLPKGFQGMLPYMKRDNWLFNYQYNWGIEKSFQGVARRAVYLNSSEAAYECFEEHYNALQPVADSFLADVKKFASDQFNQLLRT
jgi:acyl carrier protein phosphodiesterase